MIVGNAVDIILQDDKVIKLTGNWRNKKLDNIFIEYANRHLSHSLNVEDIGRLVVTARIYSKKYQLYCVKDKYNNSLIVSDDDALRLTLLGVMDNTVVIPAGEYNYKLQGKDFDINEIFTYQLAMVEYKDLKKHTKNNTLISCTFYDETGGLVRYSITSIRNIIPYFK